MPDKNEVLGRLAEARASYKDFLEAVESDLERERQKRIATRQGEILSLIAEAWVLGATKADLKRAYGTKDHATITGILESLESQIAVLREQSGEEGEPVNADWFSIINGSGNVTVRIEGNEFEIVELDDTSIMLDQVGGEREPRWDRRILDNITGP